MKKQRARVSFELLEDRHVPGNALSILSMAPDASILPPVSSARNDAPPQASKRPNDSGHSFERFRPELTHTIQELGLNQAVQVSSDRLQSSVGLDLKLSGIGSIFNDLGVPAKQASKIVQDSPTGIEDQSARSTCQGFFSSSTAGLTYSADFSRNDGATDALVSFLMQTGVQRKSSRSPQMPEMVVALGSISISPTTHPAGANPEQLLPVADKLHPGWFSNVNWSDDDNDGWNPTSTKTTTADPGTNVTYTPDKNDSIIAGGDRDLRKFVVSVTDALNTPNPNYEFRLTFSNSVQVYFDNTKSGGAAVSGDYYGNLYGGMTISGTPGGTASTGQVTFWLEGVTASTAFKDAELKAEYTGGNIPLNKLTDTVNVTVFGVDQTGIFSGGQQADNPAKFSTVKTGTSFSLDENGKVSWDQQQYIGWETVPPPGRAAGEYCVYFHNCMELQGTVSPPRDVQNSVYYGWSQNYSNPTELPSPMPVPLVTFDLKREIYSAGWERHNGNWTLDIPSHVDFMTWSNDSPASALGKVEMPSIDSHIYFIDAPGYLTKIRNNNMVEYDYKQSYDNFRNWVTIKIYGNNFMCSNLYRWHSQIILKPKPNTNFYTRAKDEYQKLAQGWIEVPSAPETTTANW